jgi:phage shock protein PspC (stress-responsive transcriptional regulator)
MSSPSGPGTVDPSVAHPAQPVELQEPTVNVIHTQFARQGLVRTQEGRLLGGVCSGLAQRTGADPWAIRALFAATLIAIPGSQLLVYPLLWVLMPGEEAVSAARQQVA